MATREKKIWLRDLLTPSACTIGILSTLTYTKFDCVALLAGYVIIVFGEPFCFREVWLYECEHIALIRCIWSLWS